MPVKADDMLIMKVLCHGDTWFDMAWIGDKEACDRVCSLESKNESMHIETWYYHRTENGDVLTRKEGDHDKH